MADYEIVDGAMSRLWLPGTPALGRIEAAAADPSLDSARAKLGTAWTNRLAALLPDGWRVGPCHGVAPRLSNSGEPFDDTPFAPFCLDRIECTQIRQVAAKWVSNNTYEGVQLSVVAYNEDEGITYQCGTRVGIEESDTFSVAPEHLRSVQCTLDRRNNHIRKLRFEDTSGVKSRAFGCDEHISLRRSPLEIAAPPGLVIRNFYGSRMRVDKYSRELEAYETYIIVCSLGVIFGPPIAVWRPCTPVRFSDAATARVDAVLALASASRGPLSRLPEVVVHHVLGFATSLFGETVTRKPPPSYADLDDDLDDARDLTPREWAIIRDYSEIMTAAMVAVIRSRAFDSDSDSEY